MKSFITRTLAVALAMSLAGTTQLAQAWQTATPTQSQPTQAQPTTGTQPTGDQNQQPQAPAATTNPATAPTTDNGSATQVQENNASDPKHVPAPAEVLPAPPATQDEQVPAAPSSTINATGNQTKTQQPLGTAAAEKGATRGGAASRPAGTAVAGRKQNQSRGILIKVGAALAAGAALGTVYALSRGTAPVPPGAVR
jgi:outer membrane biosynthesis protein TonB